jgi:O-antigen ligase
MHQETLAGTWQGVFPHKEVLGPVMATAVFVEVYLLMTGKWRPRWRLALLATYASLVVLSQSRAAWFLSAAYCTAAALYLVWKRDRVIGLMVSMTAVVVVVSGATLFSWQPDVAFSIIGKDATLTGRTRLWPAVIELITEKPLLGWGYRAMWQPDDAVTAMVEQRVEMSVPSSHNAFLEIGLQLGAAGVLLIVSIIGQALRRGYQCFTTSGDPTGWFLIVFAAGAIVTAQILDSIGQNQAIEWVLFNTLLFACGSALVSYRRREQTPPQLSANERVASPTR